MEALAPTLLENSEDTQLFYAVSEGHTEVIQLLINAGASVNEENILGKTPLFYAASEGHTEVLKILINKEA